MKGYAWMLCLLLAAHTLAADVTLSSESAERLVFTLNLADATIDGQGDWSVINSAGLIHPDTPGEPDVPYALVFVAVPPGGSAQASLQMGKREKQRLSRPLRPVPTVYAPTADGVDHEDYIMNRSAYAARSGEAVEVQPSFVWRGYTLVPVRLNPYTYDYSSGDLSLQRIMTVTVNIAGNTRYSQEPPKGMRQALEQVILNWDTAQNWRTPQRPEVNYANFAAWPAWVRFEVAQDGIYQLTYANLSGKLDLDAIDTDELRLFSTGGVAFDTIADAPGLPFTEVPLLVDDGGDHSLDSGDRLLFYARNRDGDDMNDNIDNRVWFNPYSQNTTYWLTYGASDTAPLRITSVSGLTPAITRQDQVEMLRVEQENVRRTESGFDWFMDEYAYNGSSTNDYTYNFTLRDVVQNQQQRLTLGIQEEYYESSTNHTHRLQAAVNDSTIIDYTWGGTSYKTIYQTGNFLADGQNTLVVRLIRYGAYNLYFDYYKVQYNHLLYKRDEPYVVNVRTEDARDPVKYIFCSPWSSNLRAFVVTDFNDVCTAPIVQEDDGYYLVAETTALGKVWVVDEADYRTPLSISAVSPTDLTVKAAGAEAIIITSKEFESYAEELAGIYESDLGLQTCVALQSDIFDQFSGGNPDPVALRNFIKYVYGSSEDNALTYVTLLGSGVFDWRNFSGSTTGKNHVIVWQIGSISSDDYIGYLSQVSYPEVCIGRYPAWNTTELQFLLDRTRERIEEPEGGWWRNTVLILADDQHNGSTHSQVDHTDNAQTNSKQITPAMIVKKIMAINYDLDVFQNKPEVRDLMIDEINEGVLVWYYTGHGGPTKIGDEDYFTIADIPKLKNGNKRRPLFIAASCSVGTYDLWSVQSLAEQVLFGTSGGAIASFAASCESSGPSNTTLIGNLFKQILNNRLNLGQGMLAAKMISGPERSKKYILFGDPTLELVPPQFNDDITIEGDPDSLEALQTVDIAGRFDADLDGEAEVRVYDSETWYTFAADSAHVTEWSEQNNYVFHGQATTIGGEYASRFIVPYDIVGGATGKIISMCSNDEDDYISYTSPLAIQGHNVVMNNPDAPTIQLWLNSKDFLEGDPVGSDPTLIAAIADSNGVNMLGKSGHKILARTINDGDFIDVTDYFLYDLDSWTSGELSYQFSDLATGPDSIEVIAFDNLNRATVAHLGFTVSGGGSGGEKVSIERLVPYPNPFNGREAFYFTFMLTESADVTIDLYTITGRKIRTLRAPGLSSGYRQVAWDGRDADGDAVANNTYFYRIRAKGAGGSGSDEKRGKVMVLR